MCWEILYQAGFEIHAEDKPEPLAATGQLQQKNNKKEDNDSLYMKKELNNKDSLFK